MEDAQFIESKRRTIGILIRATGEVVVRYPKRVGRREAEKFLESKRAWVEKTVEKVKRSVEAQSRESAAREARGEVKHVCAATCIRASFIAFTPRYVAMCEQFGVTSCDRPTLGVRRMRARWGHYKVTRQYGARIEHSVTLSTRLLHVPTYCLDMVIAHELCHIRYRSHGPRFKAYLTQMCPEWKAASKELKRVSEILF